MEQRPKLTLERTFPASLEEVWELWTTKEGIEAWMGPDGFSVAVSELDVRPGGRFAYAMIAVAPEQVEFMTTSGMPRVSESSGRYVQVDPPRRLVYRDLVGFIPGVEPYEVETVVELTEVGGGTHMRLTFDAMRDARWTEMGRLGRENAIRNMEQLLAARS
jgi:uncharacterized protein YndB with AHSA1/START domain